VFSTPPPGRFCRQFNQLCQQCLEGLIYRSDSGLGPQISFVSGILFLLPNIFGRIQTTLDMLGQHGRWEDGAADSVWYVEMELLWALSGTYRQSG
jgi:hypothetical protein